MTQDFYRGSFMSFAEMPQGANPDDAEPGAAPQEEDAETSEDTAEAENPVPENETEENPVSTNQDDAVETPEE